MENRSHIVFGTGPLGLSVMRALVERGAGNIRMVNRSGRLPAGLPEGVEVVKGDITDPASVRALTIGAEEVYICAQPEYTQWPEKFPPIIEGAIAGLTGSGARVIFGDNLYMYGPVDGPMREDMSYAATGRKGVARAKLANTLMEAHRAGKVRAAIGRSSDFYGPFVLDSAVGDRVFKSALAGKAADIVGDPDAPHTYMFISDFG
ncbi:MAG: NAD-dependent epimerase/dehydratase family protein, partial [Chloroflexia bacterium]